MFRIFTRQSVACNLTPVKRSSTGAEGKDCETIRKLEILRKNVDVEGGGHLPKLRRGLRSMDTDKPFIANPRTLSPAIRYGRQVAAAIRVVEIVGDERKDAAVALPV